MFRSNYVVHQYKLWIKPSIHLPRFYGRNLLGSVYDLFYSAVNIFQRNLEIWVTHEDGTRLLSICHSFIFMFIIFFQIRKNEFPSWRKKHNGYHITRNEQQNQDYINIFLLFFCWNMNCVVPYEPLVQVRTNTTDCFFIVTWWNKRSLTSEMP